MPAAEGRLCAVSVREARLGGLEPALEVAGQQPNGARSAGEQAAGDFQALQEHRRRVYRVTLADFLAAAGVNQ